MSYITSADVLEMEKILIGHDIDDLITESDSAVNDLAVQKGVFDSDNIQTDPMSWTLKRYAVTWVVVEALKRYAAGNNNELNGDVDRYYVKLMDIYLPQLKNLDKKITYEMITGTVTNVVSRSSVRQCTRG